MMETLKQIEKRVISERLAKMSRKKVAKSLGISYSGLILKMKKWDIVASRKHVNVNLSREQIIEKIRGVTSLVEWRNNNYNLYAYAWRHKMLNSIADELGLVRCVTGRKRSES